MRNSRSGRCRCFDPERPIPSPHTHNGLAHKNTWHGMLREWVGWGEVGMVLEALGGLCEKIGRGVRF